jgi:hypothetical protein
VKSKKERTQPPKKGARSPRVATDLPRPMPFPPQGGGITVVPWTSILGEDERPLAERSHRDGQGLVVLLGPLDSLCLDLRDAAEALPQQLQATPEPLVILPAPAGASGVR